MTRTKNLGRTWPKKAAATVLTPAILTPLVSAGLLANPAGANSTQDKSFGVGGGTTCTLRITRQFPYAGNPRLGRASTQLIGGSGPNANTCLSVNNSVHVGADWYDPAGQFVISSTLRGGTFVDDTFAPIGNRFETDHAAYVQFCGCFSPFFTLTK